MESLLLELALAPSLIALGTLAQRRWGPKIGGLVVGLPLTSLPLLLLVALVHGPRFAAGTAAAGLAGVVPQTLLVVTWAAALRRHGPLKSLASGMVAFAAAAAGLALVAPWPALPAAGAAVVALLVALRWWPDAPSAEPGGHAWSQAGRPRSDLPVRLALAAGFTVAVGQSAGVLGPERAGLVSALPVITIVMALLTARSESAAAGAAVLRGVTRGSFASVSGLVVLALGLSAGHLVLAFAGAAAAAAVTQLLAGLVPEAPVPARAPEPAGPDDTGQWRVHALRG